jgi:hypothetical protein
MKIRCAPRFGEKSAVAAAGFVSSALFEPPKWGSLLASNLTNGLCGHGLVVLFQVENTWIEMHTL